MDWSTFLLYAARYAVYFLALMAVCLSQTEITEREIARFLNHGRVTRLPLPLGSGEMPYAFDWDGEQDEAVLSEGLREMKAASKGQHVVLAPEIGMNVNAAYLVKEDRYVLNVKILSASSRLVTCDDTINGQRYVRKLPDSIEASFIDAPFVDKHRRTQTKTFTDKYSCQLQFLVNPTKPSVV